MGISPCELFIQSYIKALKNINGCLRHQRENIKYWEGILWQSNENRMSLYVILLCRRKNSVIARALEILNTIHRLRLSG